MLRIFDHSKLSSFLKLNFGYFFFILFFIFKFPNNFTGLSDAYQFRQTQTAWGVREVIENGFNFFHLRLPVLGYPYEVPFEFPIFQNIAGFVGRFFDTSPELAGRSTSLLFYCLTGVITYHIVLKFTSTPIAIFCVTTFYLTPFSLQWSNSILIESTAIFFLVLSISLSIKFWESNRLYLLILSSISLGVSALTKITTVIPSVFLIWIILALLSSVPFRLKKTLFFSLAHFLAMIPAFLWTNFADSIKSKSPLTQWLTSESLRGWNFGSIDQRLSTDNWILIFARYWLLGGLLVLVVIPGLIIIKNRKLWNLTSFLLILLPVFSPLVFFNLYVIHDYYFLAVLFPSILAVSLLMKFLLLNQFSSRKLSFVVFTSLVLLIPSWFLDVPGRDYVAWLQNDRNLTPQLSLEISTETFKSDRILVVGCDWDPTILYYAERYGIAAPDWIVSTNDALNFVEKNQFVDAPKFLAICGSYLPPDGLWKARTKRVSENIWKIE
jgi:4-amino-4-deoxy-L-arabinose transferase-like glycosyltransferase